MKEGRILVRSINEIIWIEDTKEQELLHIKEKYLGNWDLIYIEVREVFITRIVTRALIKCSYRFNQYGIKDTLINKIESIRECPWYSVEYED